MADQIVEATSPPMVWGTPKRSKGLALSDASCAVAPVVAVVEEAGDSPVWVPEPKISAMQRGALPFALRRAGLVDLLGLDGVAARLFQVRREGRRRDLGLLVESRLARRRKAPAT